MNRLNTKSYLKHKAKLKRLFIIAGVVWAACLMLFGYLTYDRTYLCPLFPDTDICVKETIHE